MDLATVPSLLTALGAGGALGQYIGAGKARREVRSALLNAIENVEECRFAKSPDSEDYPDFEVALREFETAALIARAPRSVAHHYIVLAQAARFISGGSVDYDPVENGFFGSIPFEFDAVVRETARLIARWAWNPWKPTHSCNSG